MSTVRLKSQLVWLVAIAVQLPHPDTNGSTRDAARQVSSGISKHRRRDFVGAEQAFAEAAKVLPDDPRIAFDQACALAAQGKHADAEAIFERTKLARDLEIRAGSLYNLGCVAVRQAQEKFGEKPEEAVAAVREEGMVFIDQAVMRYRDCLAADPDHAEARHNLEVLRLWVKHIREVWKERDRQQRRNEMDLLSFLDMLTREQSRLRGATRELARLADSPRRRQAASMLGQSQRELAEEIPPLQQKIRAELTPPSSTAPNAAPSSALPTAAQWERALAALDELARQSQSAMTRAAADLAAQQLPIAEESQSQALQPLDDIYRTAAPFEHILQKAIRVEESIIPATELLRDSSEGEKEREALIADLPVDQQRVAGWVEVLAPKAEQAIEALKSQPVAAGPAPPPNASQSRDPASAVPLEPAAQREAQLAAYNKAIELAPNAHAAAKDAASALGRQAWQGAIPHEETTLKILREIAEQLPKPPNQDPQSEQQPEKGNPQQQDQKLQDQPQEKSKQDGKQDPQQQNADQKQKPSPEKAGQEKSQDRSQREAESLLRMVRERERDYRESLKKRQAVLGGVKVDKDW